LQNPCPVRILKLFKNSLEPAERGFQNIYLKKQKSLKLLRCKDYKIVQKLIGTCGMWVRTIAKQRIRGDVVGSLSLSLMQLVDTAIALSLEIESLLLDDFAEILTFHRRT
jgi:hypothetical protein